jgi:hypothetical protein
MGFTNDDEFSGFVLVVRAEVAIAPFCRVQSQHLQYSAKNFVMQPARYKIASDTCNCSSYWGLSQSRINYNMSDKCENQ